jgi:hypothetical protein
MRTRSFCWMTTIEPSPNDIQERKQRVVAGVLEGLRLPAP